MTQSDKIDGNAPRLLLRTLRKVMAESGPAQDRLDTLVSSIADVIGAEVCSIYILRAGDQLELFATKGLKRKAVHKTKLRVGEGLVGEIARTARSLNLLDAPTHPKFVYRRETGEDPFHSFLGVPLNRGGHVLGVLVVQNTEERHYDVEEQEALETIASFLAEVVASGQLIDLDETVIEAEVRPTLPYQAVGSSFADGIGVGHIVLHAAPVIVEKLLAEDSATELKRLADGVEALKSSIDSILSSTDSSLVGESHDVLETYRMFANDAGWMRRMEEAIQNGLTAEAAVQQVQGETRARLLRQRDPYLRERLHDLDDLANRLLRQLMGLSAPSEREDLPHDAIIAARNLGPAELLEYDSRRIRAVILEEGSGSSHVAIVAKALGIPMVGYLEGLLDHVNEGDSAIVDGEFGDIHIRPNEDVLSSYEAKVSLRQERAAEFAALRNEPAVTVDGQRLQLQINAGLLVDLPHLQDTGADGIGLFRTELQFMISSTMPRLPAQSEFYGKVLKAAGKKPVTFRTLDLGGDKVLPYGRFRREENPALGLRAIRLALARPAMLRYQMRAMLTAAAGQDLNLMFPMVSEVDEFVDAKELLALEMERFERLGQALPSRVRVGCMIEVPSIAWQMRSLLRHTDFISVGSNDLMQFFFAADRGNPEISSNYDFLSPSLLGLLRSIVMECQRAEVPLSLCGEAAGRPLEAMALIGLGFRTISMPPASIGPVKLMAQRLHVGELEKLMTGLFDRSDHSVRLALKIFAENHGLPV